jgi:hypothetical protein
MDLQKLAVREGGATLSVSDRVRRTFAEGRVIVNHVPAHAAVEVLVILFPTVIHPSFGLGTPVENTQGHYHRYEHRLRSSPFTPKRMFSPTNTLW